MSPTRRNPPEAKPKPRSKPKPMPKLTRKRRPASARATAVSPGTPTKELRDALETLYQALSSAYWSAVNPDAKGRLRGAADAVSQIQADFDIAAIEAATAEYEALKTALLPVKKRLESLRADLDSLIHVVSVVTMVATAIDSALAVIALL